MYAQASKGSPGENNNSICYIQIVISKDFIQVGGGPGGVGLKGSLFLNSKYFVSHMENNQKTLHGDSSIC